MQDRDQHRIALGGAQGHGVVPIKGITSIDKVTVPLKPIFVLITSIHSLPEMEE